MKCTQDIVITCFLSTPFRDLLVIEERRDLMEPLVFKVLLEMLVFLELMDNLEKLYVAGLMITIVNTYVYLLCVCV